MKKAAVIYLVIFTVGVVLSYIGSDKQTGAMPISTKNIVIDAGHGGYDPGKVAADGTEEKDINLSIAKLLAGYMRQGGANVMLTRTDDAALSDTKRGDLDRRVKLADGKNTGTFGATDIFISIHQNSYPQESVHGAQVFYKKDSKGGKELALCIQKRLKDVADSGNTRMPKSGDSYYVLKNSKVPSVIVECGFLSNKEENEKLKDETYRQHLAWAIYMGVSDYLNGKTFM